MTTPPADFTLAAFPTVCFCANRFQQYKFASFHSGFNGFNQPVTISVRTPFRSDHDAQFAIQHISLDDSDDCVQCSDWTATRFATGVIAGIGRPDFTQRISLTPCGETRVCLHCWHRKVQTLHRTTSQATRSMQTRARCRNCGAHGSLARSSQCCRSTGARRSIRLLPDRYKHPQQPVWLQGCCEQPLSPLQGINFGESMGGRSPFTLPADF